MQPYAPTNGTGDPTAIAPALAPPPPFEPGIPDNPAPHLSDLDRLAKQKFKKTVDQLSDGDMDELSGAMLSEAARDRLHWSGRNQRMLEDQVAFELAGGVIAPLGSEHLEIEEIEAAELQSYRTPIPWTFVTKMTAMLAGAGFRIHLPPERIGDQSKAQAVENFCRHTWVEMSSRMRLSGLADPLRILGHYGPLRGWMAALIMPQSDGADPALSWTFEDPLYLYPRWSRQRGLIRVTRQYTISAIEARNDYPEAEELLAEDHDDAQVQIVEYWDEHYHCTLIEGGTGSRNPRRALLGVPVRHGIVDFTGRPVNPWIITVPMGDLTTPGRAAYGSGARTSASTRMYGPGVLYALHETCTHLNRLLSMLLTQVAKLTDPPDITYIREGQQITEPVKTERGAHNFLFVDQKYQTIDAAPNPTNFQPLFQFLVDQVAKLTFPAPLYGTNGGTSGYDTGMLQKTALDIVLPWSEGLAFMLEHIHRRTLEITYHITAGAGKPENATRGAIAVPAQEAPGGRQLPASSFDPSVIGETGVAVKVKLGHVLPQDEAAMTASLTAMFGMGAISPWTVMTRMGIEDPQLEFEKIATYKFLQSNPGVAMLYAKLAASMSDDEQLQWAIQAAAAMEAQQAQQQQPAAGEDMRQNGQAQQPNHVLPTSAQNGGQTTNQPGPQGAAGNSNAAALMASMGGSPERPA